MPVLVKRALLSLMLFGSLTFPISCGMESDAERVTDMIEALGDPKDLTIASEEAVTAAKTAYDTLLEPERAEVPNAEKLEEATAIMDGLRTEAMIIASRQEYVGEWVELSEELPVFTPIVSWYGPLILKEDGTYSSDRGENVWTLTDDRTQLILTNSQGKLVLDILDDGEYTRLIHSGTRLCFLRRSQVDDYIDSRFVTKRVTGENIRDIIGAPAYVGRILDEKDRPTNEGVWIQESLVYGDGLVYYGRSENFSYTIREYTATGPVERELFYPFDSLTAPLNTRFDPASSAKGSLTFIREKFVEENVMTDSRTRTLRFTDGTSHTTSQNWYGDVVPYDDHHY